MNSDKRPSNGCTCEWAIKSQVGTARGLGCRGRADEDWWSRWPLGGSRGSLRQKPSSRPLPETSLLLCRAVSLVMNSLGRRHQQSLMKVLFFIQTNDLPLPGAPPIAPPPLPLSLWLHWSVHLMHTNRPIDCKYHRPLFLSACSQRGEEVVGMVGHRLVLAPVAGSGSPCPWWGCRLWLVRPPGTLLYRWWVTCPMSLCRARAAGRLRGLRVGHHRSTSPVH